MDNIRSMLMRLYNNFKKVLVCATVVAVSKLINISETYVVENIILVQIPEYSYLHNSNSNPCPYKQARYKSDAFSSQYSLFYWSKEEKAQTYKIRKFAPLITYIFTGIIADKYGGQTVIFLSLIISSVVTGIQYLAMFNNPYIFVTMVAIRRFGEGLRTIAWVSLAMQWSTPNKRCTFVGVTVASLQIGRLFGYLIPRFLDNWKHVCHFSSFLGFITSLWWWLISRRPEYRFKKPSRSKEIPWRAILTSKYFYILILLVISDDNFRFLSSSFYYYLSSFIHFNLEIQSAPYYKLVVLFHLTGITSCLYTGLSSDYIFKKRLVRISVIRKFFVVLAFLLTILAIFAVTIAECSVSATLACTMLVLFSACMMQTNVILIIIDASPFFACTLYGLLNFISDTISTTSMSFLEKQESNKGHEISQYMYRNKIFFVVLIYSVVTAIPYLLCAQKKVLGYGGLIEFQQVGHLDNTSANPNTNVADRKENISQNTTSQDKKNP